MPASIDISRKRNRLAPHRKHRRHHHQRRRSASYLKMFTRRYFRRRAWLDYDNQYFEEIVEMFATHHNREEITTHGDNQSAAHHFTYYHLRIIFEISATREEITNFENNRPGCRLIVIIGIGIIGCGLENVSSADTSINTSAIFLATRNVTYNEEKCQRNHLYHHLAYQWHRSS